LPLLKSTHHLITLVLCIDNPKLQAEIARGVRQDKLARAGKKGKKVL
jgi:hypothetical protein